MEKGKIVPFMSFMPNSFLHSLTCRLLISAETHSLFPAYVACRSNLVCDNKHMIVGLSDGSLYNISWKGEVILFEHVLIV